VEGLCHISEAGDDATKLETGMEHEFKIIKINVEEKKVGLSLRAVGQEAAGHRWSTTRPIRTSIRSQAPRRRLAI